ncbi:MAG: redoxin domain-containing protein [Planctomycetota bacterium]
MKPILRLAILALAGACTTPPTPLTSTSRGVLPASATQAARSTTAAAPRALASEAAEGAPSVPFESRPVALGQPAPDFTLKDTAGREVELASFQGKIVVLEWYSTTCPYSVFAHDQGPLRDLPDEVGRKGGVWLSISSKLPNERGGTAQEQEEFARRYGLRAPLLVDAEQTVARAYEAKTTPHLFVINAKGVLVYRGALDNAPLGRVKDGELRTNYIHEALNELRSGVALTRNESEPYGCAIKLARPLR